MLEYDNAKNMTRALQSAAYPHDFKDVKANCDARGTAGWVGRGVSGEWHNMFKIIHNSPCCRSSMIVMKSMRFLNPGMWVWYQSSVCFTLDAWDSISPKRCFYKSVCHGSCCLLEKPSGAKLAGIWMNNFRPRWPLLVLNRLLLIPTSCSWTAKLRSNILHNAKCLILFCYWPVDGEWGDRANEGSKSSNFRCLWCAGEPVPCSLLIADKGLVVHHNLPSRFIGPLLQLIEWLNHQNLSLNTWRWVQIPQTQPYQNWKKLIYL